MGMLSWLEATTFSLISVVFLQALLEKKKRGNSFPLSSKAELKLGGALSFLSFLKIEKIFSFFVSVEMSTPSAGARGHQNAIFRRSSP